MGNTGSEDIKNSTTIREPQKNADGEFVSSGDALDMSHKGIKEIPKELVTSTCDYQQVQMFNNRLSTLKPLTGGGQLIECIRHCRDLNVAGNQLKELPKELGQMKSLTSLDVGYNLIPSLHESILRLPKLKRLVLRHNELTWLEEPDGIVREVEHLDITGNKFTSMPRRLFYKMTALKQLLMASNQLEVLDGADMLSPTLEFLDCSSNAITQLPACPFEPIQGRPNYALTSNLQVLLLHNQTKPSKSEKKFFSWSNKNEEDDEEYAQLPLMLSWNVYHTIRRADNMHTLNLSGLGLWDKCFLDPDEMTKLHQDPTYQPEEKPDDALNYLVNLTDLDLSFNNLDVFSQAFQNMTKLRRLILRNNMLHKLDGIRFLTELEELDAQYNWLASIPVAVNNLTNLRRLLLNNNRLKAIPATLMHCFKLKELTIGFNVLQVLPEELGTLDLSIFTFHPNPRLTHPPKDIQAQGPEAMLSWMRSRVAHSKMALLDPRKAKHAGGDGDMSTQMVDLGVELWGAPQSFGSVKVGASTTLEHLREQINLELDTAPERYQFVCDNCSITAESEHRELALTYMPVIQLFDETSHAKKPTHEAEEGDAEGLQDTRDLKNELLKQLRRMKMLKKTAFTPQEGKEIQEFKMPNPLQSNKNRKPMNV